MNNVNINQNSTDDISTNTQLQNINDAKIIAAYAFKTLITQINNLLIELPTMNINQLHYVIDMTDDLNIRLNNHNITLASDVVNNQTKLN